MHIGLHKHKQTSRHVDTHACTHACTLAWLHERRSSHGGLHSCASAHVHVRAQMRHSLGQRRPDGQTHRQRDRQTDRQTDGDKQAHTYIHGRKTSHGFPTHPHAILFTPIQTGMHTCTPTEHLAAGTRTRASTCARTVERKCMHSPRPALQHACKPCRGCP